MQDVITPDMRFDAGEREQRAHAAAPQRSSSRPSAARAGIHKHSSFDKSKKRWLWVPDSRLRRLPG
jgi:hypothetical protein